MEDQLAESNLELQNTQKRLSEELTEAANYIFSILPEPRKAAPRTRMAACAFNRAWRRQLRLSRDRRGPHRLLPARCVRHGVGAALLSVTAINVLRSAALPNTDFRDPGAVLSALNEAFPMERQNNMYFTIWYGVYQRSTGALRYASAGHPASVLCKSGARS